MNVELRDLRKTFGAVRANDGISLRVPAGSICGILGENGAGKSTLMKILSGFLRPDSGEIVLDGHRVVLPSPAEALRAGIGMLHQDPLDFPAMTVMDDFLAASSRCDVSRAAAIAAREELQREFDFAFDPDAKVESLTVGERQQLEILRLLWLGANVLILDEPTTGISARQETKLFAALRKIAARGKTILLVSHKLDDVQRLCDRVVVLRRGAVAGTAEKPFDSTPLVRWMFGKDVRAEARRASSETGGVLLGLRGIALEQARVRVRNVTLDVRRGEVIGLAGMSGSGQELLLRACAGLVRPHRGEMRIGGDAATGMSYHERMRRGVAFVPAARLEEGLVAGMSVTDHCIMTDASQRLVADRARGAAAADAKIRRFSIKARAESRVEELSGGNRQKLLLSLIPDNASLILIEHPTRGLDIESAAAVWEWLDRLAARGAAIVFASAELAEIQARSDRVLVFFSGDVIGPLPSTTTTEELGQYIGGDSLTALAGGSGGRG